VVASAFSAVNRVVEDKRNAVAGKLRRYGTPADSVASGLVPDGMLTAECAENAENSREPDLGFRP